MGFLPDSSTPKQGFIPDSTLETKGTSPAGGFVPDKPIPAVEEERPWLLPNKVKEEELGKIAQKHGVSKQDLADWTSWYGGVKDKDFSLADAARFVGGETQEAGALGAPLWLWKKSQTPEMQKALDEVSTLVSSKKSVAQIAGEMGGQLIGGIAGAKAAVSLTPKAMQLLASTPLAVGAEKALQSGLVAKAVPALVPAAVGGTYGVTHSETGKEGESALVGAAGGAILGSAAPKLIKNATSGAEGAVQLTKKALSLGTLGATGGVLFLDPSKDLGERALEGASVAITAGMLAPKLVSAVENNTRAGSVIKYMRDVVQGNKPANGEVANQIDSYLESKAPQNGVVKKLFTGEKTPETLSEEELRVLTGSPDATPDMAEDILNKTKEDFLKQRGQSPDHETWDSYLKASGDSAAEDFDKFQKLKAVDSLYKAGQGVVKSLTGPEAVAFKIYDGKPAARIIDSRLGTSLSPAADRSSQKLLKASHTFLPYDQEADSLIKRMTTEDSARINQELLSGTPKSPDAVRWNSLFANVEQTAKRDLGLPVNSPIKEARLPLEEYQTAMGVKARKLGIENWSSLESKNPEQKEFLTELQNFSGEKVSSPEEARGVLGMLLADNGKLYKSIDLGASQTAVPSFVRDDNVPRLYGRWTSALKKQYAIPDFMEEVQTAVKVADYHGDSFTKDYLLRLADDVSGSGMTFGAETEKKLKRNWNQQVDQSLKAQLDRADAKQATLVNGKRDFLGMMQREMASNVYANMLGFSTKAAMQNLASPFMDAIPEIGKEKALLYYTQGLGDLNNFLRAGKEIVVQPHMASILKVPAGSKIKTNSIETYVANEGLLGPEWRGEILDPKIRDIKRSRILTALGEGNETYRKASMAGFQLSERVARATTSFMANRMAEEMRKDPSLVSQLVKDSAYKNLLMRTLQNPDAPPSKLNELLVSYMNGATMHNYDAINMSEWGRKTGPLFRQFSKFPAYTAGSIAHRLYEGGLSKGSQQVVTDYFGPLIGFQILDTALDLDKSARMKHGVSAGGLSGLSPASSVLHEPASFFGSRTPFIGEAGDVASEIGDVLVGKKSGGEGAKAIIDKSYNRFGYGAGLQRFLESDIPSIWTGEEVRRKGSLVTNPLNEEE